MFEIKMTINGKPFTEANLKYALERAPSYKAMISGFKEKVSKVLTAEEAAQITIDVQGNGINDLSFIVKGPEDIANKTKKAFSK
jgi:hypothetical protein